MEVKSEQKYDDVKFTDIDVAYTGDIQSYTLKDGVDTYTEDGDTATVTFGDGGVVRFFLFHANWIAIRLRTLRVPVSTK